jgi:hypothetical protein
MGAMLPGEHAAQAGALDERDAGAQQCVAKDLERGEHSDRK